VEFERRQACMQGRERCSTDGCWEESALNVNVASLKLIRR